jgi:hypothetical protein
MWGQNFCRVKEFCANKNIQVKKNQRKKIIVISKHDVFVKSQCNFAQRRWRHLWPERRPSIWQLLMQPSACKNDVIRIHEGCRMQKQPNIYVFLNGITWTYRTRANAVRNCESAKNVKQTVERQKGASWSRQNIWFQNTLSMACPAASCKAGGCEVCSPPLNAAADTTLPVVEDKSIVSRVRGLGEH